MMYLLTIAGFVLLFAGGESLVRGAVGIANRLGISPLLVGLTVVAFATSAPELLVALRAAHAGTPDLVLGNVVGSNIANVALILGAAGLIAPIVVDRSDIARDAYVLLAASFVFWGVALTGFIGRIAGAAFVVALIVYIVYSYRAETSAGTADEDWHAEEACELGECPPLVRSVPLVGLGLVALVLGADWLVEGATSIARSVGVPDAVVGLTIVAIGTSLPELATSVTATARGHRDVAVGNVIGSNIFNILSIVGITAIFFPIDVATSIARVDIPIMLAFTVTSVAILMWRGRVSRIFSGLLLVAYLAYVVALYAPAGL